MRKLFVILFLGFVLSSCVSDTQQQSIDAETAKILEYKEKIEQAYLRYESGELTAKEVKSLVEDSQLRIDSSMSTIKDLKSQGVSYWELAGAVLMGIASRGIPSKGAVPIVFNAISSLLGGGKKTKKK
jgi:hypothetical protein